MINFSSEFIELSMLVEYSIYIKSSLSFGNFQHVIGIALRRR